MSIERAPLRAEVRLSSDQLALAAGVRAERLARLIRLGLVEPSAPGTRTFTGATAARLRRMLRLRGDLSVNLTGAAIIVDLLERLERLEGELARLHGGPSGCGRRPTRRRGWISTG